MQEPNPDAGDALPVDRYREALVGRLGIEFGDEVLADGVVTAWDDDMIALIADRVDLGEVASAELFDYAVKRSPVSSVDSVVAFAFGHRGDDADPDRSGPMNAALAEATLSMLQGRNVHVYAQTSIARELAELGCGDVTSVDSDIDVEGNIIYLSTVGAAEKCIRLAKAAGRPMGTVAVVGFDDHLARCVTSARAAGLQAVVADTFLAPSEYDPESSQQWTRSRSAYLAIDIPARVLTTS